MSVTFVTFVTGEMVVEWRVPHRAIHVSISVKDGENSERPTGRLHASNCTLRSDLTVVVNPEELYVNEDKGMKMMDSPLEYNFPPLPYEGSVNVESTTYVPSISVYLLIPNAPQCVATTTPAPVTAVPRPSRSPCAGAFPPRGPVVVSIPKCAISDDIVELDIADTSALSDDLAFERRRLNGATVTHGFGPAVMAPDSYVGAIALATAGHFQRHTTSAPVKTLRLSDRGGPEVLLPNINKSRAILKPIVDKTNAKVSRTQQDAGQWCSLSGDARRTLRGRALALAVQWHYVAADDGLKREASAQMGDSTYGAFLGCLESNNDNRTE
ncbi:hypothetical protein F5148DRAFT_1153473, partial [Russula earlei]